MANESVVMPVRQQYLIASAIVGLIAVMVILAIFDYYNDRNRYAQTLALQQQGIGMVQPGMANANGNFPGNAARCATCGWRGQCLANGRCPNCYAGMSNPANMRRRFGAEPLETRNAGFFSLQPQPANGNFPGNAAQCATCGWRGQCLANGRCPNCYAGMWNPANMRGRFGGEPLETQNAGFFSLQPQPANPAPANGMLSCPQCNFRMCMNGNCTVAPNSVRCPRCASGLAVSGPAAGSWRAGWRQNFLQNFDIPNYYPLP